MICFDQKFKYVPTKTFLRFFGFQRINMSLNLQDNKYWICWLFFRIQYWCYSNIQNSFGLNKYYIIVKKYDHTIWLIFCKILNFLKFFAGNFSLLGTISSHFVDNRISMSQPYSKLRNHYRIITNIPMYYDAFNQHILRMVTRKIQTKIYQIKRTPNNNNSNANTI